MSEPELPLNAKMDQLYLELNEIYHGYAKQHGLSDSMLWLLYSLRAQNGRPTQRRLCDAWHTSPQTMNYALKALERQGYVHLKPLEGGRHDKEIVVAKPGQGLIDNVVEPLMREEHRALTMLSPAEQLQLVQLMTKLVSALRMALNPAGKPEKTA